ncbi:MAG: hypothetical protein ABJF88_10735 [Rhodothermales bacterium]
MSDEKQRANVLEKIVAGLGALLLLAVVALLVLDLASHAGEPADLRVALGAPVSRSGQVFVPVRVRNVGGHTAEEAVIEVCASSSNCATVSFSYVPRGSAREGVVGLRAPLEAAPTARVTSYRTP